MKPFRRLALAAGIASGGIAALPALPASAAPDKPASAQKKKHAGAKPGRRAPPAGPAAPSAPRAAPAAAAGEAPVSVSLDVRRVTLANGLRVVIDVDHTSPTVGIAVAYDVGARDEEQGRTGFAHLFEHMMFQGSRNVQKAEHSRLVASHGGVSNGTTDADRTLYYEGLPENELALALWLEADRMRSLDVSRESFESQRKVVEEEYRMRVSNVAYTPARIRVVELAYQGYWPYEHPTIGTMADLDGARLEWVQAFHASHYGPNTAVLAVAGDVDPDAALALVHQYFDPIPRVAAPPFANAALPEQTSERTAVIKDDHARTPGVFYGWAVPPARHADHYALELLTNVLAEGESSRLHQLLVRDRALAQSVWGGTGQRRGPDVFNVDVILAEGKRPAEVERLVEAEIKALATRGPTAAELSKARRRVETAFVLGLSTNLARARRLADFEVATGDARQLPGELSRYLAVTQADVQRAAAQYLVPTRRTLVEAYPADGPGKDAGDDRADKPRSAPPPAAAPAAAPRKHGGHGGHGKHRKRKEL